MSSHLLELQKEIKEEEEEIFADINSLINSHSNLLYSTLDDYDDDRDNNYEEDERRTKGLERDEIRLNQFSPATLNHRHHNLLSTITNNINSKFNDNNNTSSVNLSSDYHSNNTDDHLFAADNSDDLIAYQSVDDAATNTTATQDYQDDSARSDDHQHESQNRLHHHHHNFRFDDSDQASNDFITHNDDIGSHYLHEEQYDKDSNEQANHENDDPHYMDEQTFAASNQEDQQDYQALQAVIQQVTSNLPKPCVFFLEGNCRRSDCKYSHDLSNITCKYWIEGFCFKGELCPFLHSYNPLGDSQETGLVDDDGLPKKQLNPTFAIDSEADFPSLPFDTPAGALNDSTKSNINAEVVETTIKDQILSSNPSVVFKTVKKKRKRG